MVASPPWWSRSACCQRWPQLLPLPLSVPTMWGSHTAPWDGCSGQSRDGAARITGSTSPFTFSPRAKPHQSCDQHQLSLLTWSNLLSGAKVAKGPCLNPKGKPPPCPAAPWLWVLHPSSTRAGESRGRFPAEMQQGARKGGYGCSSRPSPAPDLPDSSQLLLHVQQQTALEHVPSLHQAWREKSFEQDVLIGLKHPLSCGTLTARGGTPLRGSPKPSLLCPK